MYASEILIGRHCFLVRAESLPTGFNQRPGVTLLIARAAPLEFEIQDHGRRTGSVFLLVPELKRRFLTVQRHYSITIEPGHSDYRRWLAWARELTWKGDFPHLDASYAEPLETLVTQNEFDTWLATLLAQHKRPIELPDERLTLLLAIIARSSEAASAESIWQELRRQHPASQSHYSHWLQERLGLSLRKLLVWRKLRNAMSAVLKDKTATFVAHEVGFADSAHLSRICSRAFGLRPSDANDRKILQVRHLT